MSTKQNDVFNEALEELKSEGYDHDTAEEMVLAMKLQPKEVPMKYWLSGNWHKWVQFFKGGK